MGAVWRGFAPECCIILGRFVLLTPHSFVLVKAMSVRPLPCLLGSGSILIVGVAYLIICFVAALFLFIVSGSRLESISFYVCVILFPKEFFQK